MKKLFPLRTGRAPRPWIVLLEKDGVPLFETRLSDIAGPISIGRDADCAWCLAGRDSSVSGRHAELFLRNGLPVVRDLGSRNGIRFRGERIQEASPGPGEAVQLGNCRLSVEIDRAALPSNGRSARHRLELLNGPEAGRAYELPEQGEATVGSDPGCDIVLSDPLVSRRHVVLAVGPEGCVARDAGSRNGTTVDGERLAKPRQLIDGSVLGVAQFELRFLDRNAVHVRARIGAKLLATAATAGVAFALYSVWNLAHPSAVSLLARVQKVAASWSPDSGAQDFAPAFDLLERAKTARGAADAAGAIRDQEHALRDAQRTIQSWKKVRSLLSNEQWLTAREEFANLGSWSWNADSASAARRDAESVRAVLEAFLSARETMDPDKQGKPRMKPDEAPAALARLGTALDAALAGLCVSDSNGDFVAPLERESRAVRDEIGKAASEMTEFDRILSTLKPGEASAVRTKLDRIRNAHRERVDLRRREQAEKGNRYAYFIPVLEDACSDALGALRGLEEIEAAVNANLAAVASGRFDETNALPDISRAVTDARPSFKSCREALEARNGRICGTLCAEWRNRLANLERAGFSVETGRKPEELVRILDPATLQAALRFVSELDALPAEPGEAPAGAYDRLVGVVPFDEFLLDLTGGGDSVEKASAAYDRCWSRSAWRSDVAAVRALLVPLRALGRIPADDEVLNARVPAGATNRCAQAVVFAGDVMEDLDDWVRDDLVEICREDGSERARLLGGGIALLLAERGVAEAALARLFEDSSGRPASFVELGRRYDELCDRMRSIRKDSRIDSREAYRMILHSGLPGSGLFREAWNALRPRDKEDVP